MNDLIQQIKTKVSLEEKYIVNIINMLEDGCTIAFIARYRKDLTSNASDEDLLIFQEIYEYSLRLLKRKEEIINILKEKDELSDKLSAQIKNADKLRVLEDIYEPFKGIKSTRASNALKNGLESLANIISCMRYSINEIEKKAKTYINKEIKDISEAISGAQDIIALRYSQELRVKEVLRANILNHCLLLTCKTKTFEEDGLYKDLGSINIKAKFLKSHRVLAILRAVNEKQITVKIQVDEAYLLNNIKQYRTSRGEDSSRELVYEALKDGLKRLLLPSLKREFLTNLKVKASNDAIDVFGKNLHDLLITAPLVNQIILGFDPGYRTGCKLAVIDENGKYLDSSVIFLLNQNQEEASVLILLALIKKYKITAIAIGNGTASKESLAFISKLIKDNNLDVKYAVVSEIGASIYSASKIAQEEYGFFRCNN